MGEGILAKASVTVCEGVGRNTVARASVTSVRVGACFIKNKKLILPLQVLNLDDSVEQIISGHGSSSRSDPIQILPLFFGSGFVQVRILDRNVLPHICGQLLHVLHGDQPP